MPGKVYLVGAGPGDEGLITVKGLDKLKEADIVVYDYLSNQELLKFCKADCEKIYVGKSAGNHTLSQEAINELLVEKAQEGHYVVRLKGGDPFVFGRGGEEGEELFNHGIEFEVIPGITSAIGGLAYGGIPITQRELASSFHVFTGHLKNEEDDLDWPTLGKIQGTMVFLMGVGNLKHICTSLIRNGKSESTPVAIIHKATTPNQKVVLGTLESIVDKALEAKIKAPSLIVIGEVVKKRDVLNWFEEKPLYGEKIVVTRSRDNSSTMVGKLKELGAEVIEYPTIQTKYLDEEPLKVAIKDLKGYTYLILTSKIGVEVFFKTLFDLEYDTRSLGSIKVVAIGKETAKALKLYGVIPDYIPKDYVGESLVELLKEVLRFDDKILIPRSKSARTYVVEALSKICQVDEISTYETIGDSGCKDVLINQLQEDNISAITFTSSSTVDYFVQGIGRENLSFLGNVKLMSIGPITSKTIESYGLKVFKEAKQHTIDGLVQVFMSY
jgi:uroporphyrinogen III methyltransferase/synthase